MMTDKIKQFSKEELIKLRRRIQRRNDIKYKIYHEEMYNTDYWKENQYRGYKEIQNSI